MNADDDDGQLPASLQALEEATVRQGRVEFTTHKEEIKFKKIKPRASVTSTLSSAAVSS